MFDVTADLPENAVHFFQPSLDRDGRDIVLVVAKYSFLTDPTGRVSIDRESPQIDLVDTFHGKDGATSSIRRPSLLFDRKPGTDVVLLGHAHPPDGRSVSHVDVSLRVGPVAKRVRAYGLRVWQMGAFGGIRPGPARALREPRAAHLRRARLGWPLDLQRREENRSVSHATTSAAAWRETRKRSSISPPPCSSTPPGRETAGRTTRPPSTPSTDTGVPRVGFAGTYDETWEKTRAPVAPADFDHRFHVCVPEDQWSAVPLRSDEPIEVLVAPRPEGAWRVQLPRIAPGFSSFVCGQRREHATHLDTIVIDADARRIELTWRASFVMPRKLQMVEQVIVFEKRVV